jgi:hypothetical protein
MGIRDESCKRMTKEKPTEIEERTKRNITFKNERNLEEEGNSLQRQSAGDT